MPQEAEVTQATEDAVPAVAHAPMSEALFRSARVHRIMASSLLRDTGLYAGQELLMMRLWERGEQRQADLIKTLGLDPSTVTKMLQRLEQAGFVTRRPSPDDRRAVVVDTTRAGRALRDRVKQAWRDLEAATTAGFTKDEYDQAMRVLNRIEANLATPPPAEGGADGRTSTA